MSRKARHPLLGCAVPGLASAIVVWACEQSPPVKEGSPSARPGAVDAGSSGGAGLDAGTLPDGAPKDCFDHPKTHFEIINACTTATKITKNPTLPRLLPDGGLPPLD